MKTHKFVHVKTTKAYYRFQEMNEDGKILDKGDPNAEFNFGCLYLKKEHFQIEPAFLTITVEATYEKG